MILSGSAVVCVWPQHNSSDFNANLNAFSAKFSRYFTTNVWRDGGNGNRPVIETILNNNLRESTPAGVCININFIAYNCLMLMVPPHPTAESLLPPMQWECEGVKSFSDGQWSYYCKHSISKNNNSNKNPPPQKQKNKKLQQQQKKTHLAHRTAANFSVRKKNLKYSSKDCIYTY